MASIRDTLLTTLVSRIDAITGISCSMRANLNSAPSPVECMVYPENESKSLTSQEQYQCTYRVEVLMIVREEDALEDLDGGNEFRYLDRMVTEVEKVLHTPDSWGVDPDYTDVMTTGHDVEDPSDQNELYARIYIEFTYRHHYQDPSQ